MPRLSASLPLLAALVLLGLPIGASAGPLSPPPGPVASTGGTMILSLPYTISTPGWYYLANNLTATLASPEGITITASGVVLDLNGFTLIGSGGVSGTAVSISGSNVTIRDGFIRNWSRGVVGNPTNSRATNIVVTNTGSSFGSDAGISLGSNSVVTGCAVVACNRGIRVGDNSSITTSVANGCEYDGILAGNYSSVSNCTSRANGIDPSYQIIAGIESAIRDCAAEATFGSNGGIRVGNGSTVAGCSVKSTTVGACIAADMNCIITNCSIDAGNSLDPNGIRVGADSVVTDCSIRSPAGGIFASGTGVTIERNRITTPGIGIQTIGTGHFIASNKVTGTATPYVIAAGSAFGPVINVAGGGAFATTNPWANFAY